jgi:hypothetical protein
MINKDIYDGKIITIQKNMSHTVKKDFFNKCDPNKIENYILLYMLDTLI